MSAANSTLFGRMTSKCSMCIPVHNACTCLIRIVVKKESGYRNYYNNIIRTSSACSPSSG